MHIYFEIETGAPVQVVQESEEVENGLDIPMLTYDYTDVVLGAPPSNVFELDAHARESGKPHSHDDCDLHAGGFLTSMCSIIFVRF